MIPFDILISSIREVRQSVIYHNAPYLSKVPRIYHTLVLITEGILLYKMPEKTYRVQTGELFFIPKGKTDSSYSEGNSVHYFLIDFEAEADDASLGYLQWTGKQNERANDTLFRKIEQIWQERSFGCQMRCREILYGMLYGIAVHRYHESENYYKIKRIQPVLQKIHTDFSYTIGMNELALLCQMSTGNMTRLFREVTHCTPSAYLLKIRMENAKRLLMTGAYSVAEIAVQCGYTEQYSFSRAFTRLYGIAPSRWHE